MKRLLCLLICSVFLCRFALSQEQDTPDARVNAIAPFIDNETFLVARLDLARVNLEELQKMAAAEAPMGDPNVAKAMEGMKAGAVFHKQLMTAGLSRWYVIGSLARLQSEVPGFVVAPVNAGADVAAARDMLAGLAADKMQVFVKGNSLVIGPPGLEQWLGTFQPKPRTDLVKPFAAAGDTALQVIFAPNDALRALAGLQLANLPLPPEQGGAALAALKDKLQWAAITMRLPPQPAFALILQMSDQQSAEAIKASATQALNLLDGIGELKEAGAEVAEIKKALTPQLRDNQLRIVITEANGGSVKAGGGKLGESILKLLPMQGALGDM